MCGRFAFFAPREAIQLAFGTVRNLDFEPRYNIAPTQNIVAFTLDDDQALRADHFHWGLMPFWAKDPSIGNRMINARAETLAEKPSFRRPYRRRRCLIPASGFYEWQKLPEGKQPVYICAADERPLAFAGLWDEWQSPDGDTIKSCTIITTRANRFVRDLHDRMPVCLARDAQTVWLDNSAEREALDELVQEPQDAQLQFWPVSRRVNNPSNESADLIERTGT